MKGVALRLLGEGDSNQRFEPHHFRMRKFKHTFEKPSDTPGIYGILNIETGRIYVGSSTRMKRRWLEHRRTLNLGRHHNQWLQRSWNHHGPENFIFYVIAQGCSMNELAAMETGYIQKFRADTTGIFNSALVADRPPSSRGRPISIEQRKKISLALTGRPRPPEVRQAISKSNKGKSFSKISRDKMSASKLGRPLSSAHRSKLSEVRTGKPCREETRRKIGDANRGRTATLETRAKLSAAKQGKPWSPARRAAFEAKKALAD